MRHFVTLKQLQMPSRHIFILFSSPLWLFIKTKRKIQTQQMISLQKGKIEEKIKKAGDLN